MEGQRETAEPKKRTKKKRAPRTRRTKSGVTPADIAAFIPVLHAGLTILEKYPTIRPYAKVIQLMTSAGAGAAIVYQQGQAAQVSKDDPLLRRLAARRRELEQHIGFDAADDVKLDRLRDKVIFVVDLILEREGLNGD